MKNLALGLLFVLLVAVGVMIRGRQKDSVFSLGPDSQSFVDSPGKERRTELTPAAGESRREGISQGLRSAAGVERSAPLEVTRERGTPVDASLRGQLTSRCGEAGVSGALVLAWGRGPDVERIDALAADLGRLNDPSAFEISEALKDFPSFGVARADEQGAFRIDLANALPPLCIFAAKPGFASIRLWVDLEDQDQCFLRLEPLFQARLLLRDSAGQALRIRQAGRTMKHTNDPRRRGTRVDPIWAMAGIPTDVLRDVARFEAFVFTGGGCRGSADGPWKFGIDAPGFLPAEVEFSAGRVGQELRETLLVLKRDGTGEGYGSVAVFPGGLPYTVHPQRIHANVTLENEETGRVLERFLNLELGQEELFIDDLESGLWEVKAEDSCRLYPIPSQRVHVDPGLASPVALDYSQAAFLYPRDPNLAPGLESLRLLDTITFSEAEHERRREQGDSRYLATSPRSPTPVPVGPELWLWYLKPGAGKVGQRSYEEEFWIAPR
ncbi:MAG: hypothetical protein AAF368_07330, partial [Planctomycetota bacterium]